MKLWVIGGISGAIGLLCIGAGIGWTIASHHTAVQPPHPYMLIKPERYPETYRFDPKPDITAHELALSLIPMIGGQDFIKQMQPYYDAMPPEVKRHWLPLSPPKE